MTPGTTAFATAADAEIASLIATLLESSERLQSLTHGEVDAVAGAGGQAYLLLGAQTHMRERELEKSAAILDSLPANIALLDADGVIVSVNAAWRSFAQDNVMHAPGAGLGTNYLDVCDRAQGHGDGQSAIVAQGIRSVLSGAQERVELEYPCDSPTQQYWYQMTVTPVGHDAPRGAVVMHLDISQRRRAELALAELSLSTQRRERTLNTVLSSISDFTYIYDRQGKFVFANKALLDLWGLPLEQVVGRTHLELGYPPALAARLQQQIDQVHATAEPLTDETAYTGISGLPGFYEYIFSPVLGPDGSVESVVGSTRDVTERKRAAERVLRSQQHLRGLIDGLGPNMFVALLSPEGILLEVNQAPLTAAGMAAEEVLGLRLDDTHWWSHSSAARAHLRGAIERAANGEPSRYDARLLGAGGAFIDIDFSIQPLRDENGAVAFLVSSASVITERIMVETALRLSVAEQQASARLLSIERSRLLDAQRVAKIGSWETDLATMHVVWSEESQRIYETAATDDPTSHANVLGLVHPLDRERLDREFRASLQSRDAQMSRHRLQFPDGRIKFIEARWQVQFDADGVAERVVGTNQDVTERELAEVRIQRLNRGYMVLSQINALIVRVKSRDELFQEACRIAVRAGQFPLAWIGEVDVAGQRVVAKASEGADADFLAQIGERLSLAADAPFGHGPTATAVREARVVVVNDVSTNAGIRNPRVHTDRGIASLISLPLIVAGEVVAVFGLEAADVDYFDEAELALLRELAQDIAFAIDHLDKAEQLDYLACYDSLTGLANRSLFLDRARQCLRGAVVAGHGAAMVLVDLERFKGFNDSLGQAAGDSLLRQVGTWLAAHLVDPEMLARVGPDIFALMLVDAPQRGDAARHLDQLIRSFHEHPFELESGVFRIAGKFGVAMCPEDASDPESLFQKAESALKSAKAGGDRQVFYTHKMTETVARRLKLENQLRHALDNEEFVLHYQPKVELRSGQVCGAEALIRWNDPRNGLVAPLQFIPILEETGLIHDVGRWALRQALGDYLRWCSAGLRAPRIAVNVSPMQLRDPAFVADVARLLAVDDFAADGLELEITESMIMADVSQSIATLQALRELRVHVAVDDFGTGFSSLGYLSKLPVDSLKIDRSFINDMTHSPEGLSLVSTIISLAHSLQLKVVAEGVETEEQCGLLKLLRCDEMQGYLYSRPVTAEEFEARFLRPG